MINKIYRNVFEEMGFSNAEINKRVNETFDEIFYGENAFFQTR